MQIILFDVKRKMRLGQISFIDLAGNERGSDVKETNKQT